MQILLPENLFFVCVTQKPSPAYSMGKVAPKATDEVPFTRRRHIALRA